MTSHVLLDRGERCRCSGVRKRGLKDKWDCVFFSVLVVERCGL